MTKTKKDLGFDKDGSKLVMRKRDYLADMSGQLGLGLMANLVGQLTYFYTDKVGLAVGGVGIVMAIAKVIDALTNVWFGNVIDHSKGGNRKYYSWVLRMAVPAAVTTILIFTVPIQAGQVVGLVYALVTNVLLTAVFYIMISTPLAAVMVVRTRSQSERSSMGVYRAAAMYGSGMIIAIVTIPVTNLLGGTQVAWVKYGVILGLIVLLSLLICYNNGRKAEFSEDTGANTPAAEEEEAVPFKEAVSLLFKNRYWVIVLVFNLVTSITNTIVASAGTYYCKWIFGNDNLVAMVGALGLISTLLGFAFSKPIIAKLGVKKTIDFGLLGAAGAAAVRCLIPSNLIVYSAFSMIGSFVQIPLMCLYGVLLAMAVDYNEYKYDKKMVAVSSGAIGFGSQVGGGLGSIILSAFLIVGSYNSALKIATPSMRYAIYGFSNYLPLVLNLLMFFLFKKFDLEEKLPAMRKEVAERHAAKKNQESN